MPVKQSEENKSASRRGFIKGLGATALLPLLPNWAAAESDNEVFKQSKLHKVLCCNIRVALPEDEAKGLGWPQRKALCIEIIKKQKPDVICLQEVLKVQAEDLKKAFSKLQLLGFDGPEMDVHKVGYHGIAKNPIMYSTERYELISAGGYWLSETPLVAGSKSWDTARARHANWVRLKDKSSGKEFRVVNLHLDHVSGKAKIEGAKMVVEESSQYQKDFPQILAGDFNAKENSRVFDSVKAGGWVDSYMAVNGDSPPGFTVHVFEGPAYAKGQPDGKIDFIFCKGPIKSHASAIIRDNKNGLYPSDHYFLSADLELI